MHRLEDGTLAVSASPYPRPIPGVPLARNLNGISFAVANVTGVLALLLEKEPELATAEQATRALLALGRSQAHARLTPPGHA